MLSVGGGGEGFRRSPTVVTASEITPHELCTDKSQYSECVHCVGDEGSHHPLLSYTRGGTIFTRTPDIDSEKKRNLIQREHGINPVLIITRTIITINIRTCPQGVPVQSN